MAKHLPYSYEIYTKHPVRGTRGWDIQVGYVLDAPNREAALWAIKKAFGRLFDTVIQLYEVTDAEEMYSPYVVIPFKNPRAAKRFEGKKMPGSRRR